MPTRLNETAIKRMKAPMRERTVSIEGTRGLSLILRPDGTKYYYFRKTLRGKAFKHYIGSVEDFTLEQAKAEADRANKNIKQGFQPGRVSKQSGSLTFQQAYELYVASPEFSEKSPRYQDEFKLLLEKYAVQGKGMSPARRQLQNSATHLAKHKVGFVLLVDLSESLAREFYAAVKQNADGSNPARRANLVKSHCKVIFDYMLLNQATDLRSNPFSFDVPRQKARVRDRVFSKSELERLIACFGAEPEKRRQFLNCCLLTGWRNGELAKMRWVELEWDVAIAAHNHNDPRTVTIWNAPPSSNKSKRAIRFVLSNAISEQILSLPRQNEWVFTYGNMNAGGDGLPMTPPTKRVREIMCELGFPGTPTLHTIRHTLVTTLKEQGFAAAAIDRFLGKDVKEGAASHGAYDHADSLAEKLTIAGAWESYLKSLGFGSN